MGTLSIAAGATVASSNSTAGAITLRGADIEINTGANAAVIGAATPSRDHAQRHAHRFDRPRRLAFDASGNLYVANSGNDTVSKFAPGSTHAQRTLTGLIRPFALAFDGSGNLYVANSGNTVSKFAPGSTTPRRPSPV